MLPGGPAPLEPLDPAELARVFRQVLARVSSEEIVAAFTPVPRVEVEDRMQVVLAAIGPRGRVAWSEVAGESRDSAVATFLAVLELFKRNRLQLEQELPFGPLWLLAPLDCLPVALGNSAGGGQAQQPK